MSPLKKVNKAEGRKSKSNKKEVDKLKSKSKSPDLQPETLDQKPKTNLTTNILRIVAVLAVIGITVYIYSIRDRVEEFTQYGYFG
ncbi:MAG: hypothetical protein JNM46_05775, partial [Anaerolineales bacterium]|nr:hypothetical protein [Anaerolineales bacterium]